MSTNSEDRIVIRPQDLKSVPVEQPARVVVPPKPASAFQKPRKPMSPAILVSAAGVIVAGLLVATVLLATSRNEEPPAQTTSPGDLAIKRILTVNQQLLAETINAVPRDATPSRLAQVIATYCSRAMQQDFSDGPADFLVAYRQYVRAWGDVRDAVAELPDSILEGVFMGVFNAVLRKESDGGVHRLEGKVESAQQRLRGALEDLERIAAKHGQVVMQ
jgi:hypothetical protein